MRGTWMAVVVGLSMLGFTGLAHADFVGNKDSKIFHSDDCSMVKQMKDSNKVVFKTAAEATKAGYTACKKCNAENAKAMKSDKADKMTKTDKMEKAEKTEKVEKTADKVADKAKKVKKMKKMDDATATETMDKVKK